MPKLPKIHGRPRLPWWVYVAYFLLATFLVIYNHVAHGEEMKSSKAPTVKIDEPALARAIAKALKAADKEEDGSEQKAMKKAAKKGRRGDSEIAHVNPQEAAILKAMGGSGTRNPKTGLKEYYTEGEDPGGDTDRFGGAGEDTSNYSEAEARETGFYGDQYVPEGPAFDPDASPAGPPGTPGRSPSSVGMIENLLNNNAQYAMMPLGMGALAYGAKTLNDSYFGGAARADMDLGRGGAASDETNASLGMQPVAQSPIGYEAPPESAAPLSLGLGAGLTDLQKRAKIATYGTQGNWGQYRTPEAMRYYGQLIAKALIGQGGQPQEQSANILPVEQNYLAQQFGIKQSDNAKALIEALRPYWSR